MNNVYVLSNVCCKKRGDDWTDLTQGQSNVLQQAWDGT